MCGFVAVVIFRHLCSPLRLVTESVKFGVLCSCLHLDEPRCLLTTVVSVECHGVLCRHGFNGFSVTFLAPWLLRHHALSKKNSRRAFDSQDYLLTVLLKGREYVSS